jgi:DNA-binding NarL/FixJ family response regulator
MQEDRPPHPRAKPERNQEIYELRKSGMTIVKIAEKFAITAKRVRVILAMMEEKAK